MAWKGGFSGKGYSVNEFKALLETYPAVPFAKFVVIHNTDFLIDKADAYGKKHGYGQRIKNLEHYYKNEKKWSSGPHGFIEPDGKFYPGTPLNTPGTGSPSWNGSAWHLEIEADFDVDDPTSGLGLQSVEMAAHVAALLLRKQKLPATNQTIRFHKEDQATTHNCPGPKLRKDWFLAKVQSYMNGDKPVDLPPEGKAPTGGFIPKAQWSIPDVQAHLNRLGYDAGPVDGIMGPKTEAAIRSFQKAMGIVETGKVGEWLWNKMRTLPAPAPKPVVTVAPIANAELCMKYLTEEEKWPRHWAAGAVGNLQRESYPALKPAVMGDYMISGKPARSTDKGAAPTAFGIGQWRNERKAALDAFAKERGTDWSDLHTQILFIPRELKSSEKLAWKWLQKARTVEEATAAMVWYERPKGYISSKAKAAQSWGDVLEVSTRCDGWKERLAFAKALM